MPPVPPPQGGVQLPPVVFMHGTMISTPRVRPMRQKGTTSMTREAVIFRYSAQLSPRRAPGVEMSSRPSLKRRGVAVVHAQVGADPSMKQPLDHALIGHQQYSSVVLPSPEEQRTKVDST